VAARSAASCASPVGGAPGLPGLRQGRRPQVHPGPPRHGQRL